MTDKDLQHMIISSMTGHIGQRPVEEGAEQVKDFTTQTLARLSPEIPFTVEVRPTVDRRHVLITVERPD